MKFHQIFTNLTQIQKKLILENFRKLKYNQNINNGKIKKHSSEEVLTKDTTVGLPSQVVPAIPTVARAKASLIHTFLSMY